MVTGIESAQLKIARAATHLDEINHLIREATARTDAYEIIKDTDGKETVNFLIGPPRDVMVIVGEVVYQLRSVLDHLAFHLVKSNPRGIILSKNWEKGCAFPLHLKIPTHGKHQIPYKLPVPISFFEKTLPGISKAAYTFIQSVQPYHTGPGTHNVLRIIAQLANIDKHRHLHIMLPRVAVHRHVTFANGDSSVSTVGGLKHGAKIPLPDAPTYNAEVVKVERSFSPYITFDEIGPGPDTLESQNVLEVCLQQVETVIIPAMADLIQNP